jgi:hypothetical protein
MKLDLISALARIPQTPDGPAWSQASPEDVALADRLYRDDELYIKNLALGEVKRKGGAIRVKDRGQYLRPHWDRVTFAAPADKAYGVDSHWDDIESYLLVWHHEAACRFDPTKGVPWQGWLAQVIPHRVRDYLLSGSTAGTVDHGDGPRNETTFETIEANGQAHVFAAANEEVRAANNPILSAFWFDRKQITQIAKEQGVGKAAISKQITKLRETLPNLDRAIKIERDVRRGIKRSQKETFCRPSRINYDHPILPEHVGSRQLVLVEAADPELPLGSKPRTLYANVEPVGCVFGLLRRRDPVLIGATRAGVAEDIAADVRELITDEYDNPKPHSCHPVAPRQQPAGPCRTVTGPIEIRPSKVRGGLAPFAEKSLKRWSKKTIQSENWDEVQHRIENGYSTASIAKCLQDTTTKGKIPQALADLIRSKYPKMQFPQRTKKAAQQAPTPRPALPLLPRALSARDARRARIRQAFRAADARWPQPWFVPSTTATTPPRSESGAYLRKVLCLTNTTTLAA